MQWIRIALVLGTMLAFPLAGAHSAPLFNTPAHLTILLPTRAPVTVVGAGTVDVTGNTITVPAGLVSLTATLTVPVTGFSAVNSIVVTKLSNLSATFSPGGATGQVAGETCPPASGQACVDGGGLGGVMALTGVLFIHVIPNVVVLPINLNQARFGQGGSASSPFSFDAAPWTTGVARVNTGSVVATTGMGEHTVSLVTGTFVSACGNLLPIFASFTLQGVPEPGAALLSVLGGLGLVALAIGRARRR